MNDFSTPQPGPGSEPHLPEVAKDLESLAEQSRVAVPTLEDTARAVAARETKKETRGMSTTTGGRRPAWGFAAAAAVIALALIFVPVSYDKTVGHELSFQVQGAQLTPPDVDGLVSVLQTQISEAPVRVELGDRAEIRARFTGKSRADVEAVAAALQRELTAKGLEASFSVEPMRERISSNVYAYAAAQWQDINVPTAGRSDAEIENDIRSQLAGMGFGNADVRYESTPDGAKMRVEAESPDGHKLVAETHREGGPAGEPVKLMMLDPSETKGKSDAEIKAMIEQKLREQGIYDAEVTVENGRVEVKAERHQ